MLKAQTPTYQDISEDHEVVDEKWKEVFGISNSTPMVKEVSAEVRDIVAERRASLAGAGIVGIIKKTGRIANKRSAITMGGGKLRQMGSILTPLKKNTFLVHKKIILLLSIKQIHYFDSIEEKHTHYYPIIL